MPPKTTLSLGMSSDLTPAQNERLRRAMDAYKHDECSGSVTELAKRLGRKQPSISDVLNRKGGASYGTATRFAELIGKDVRDVIGPAEAAKGEDLKEGLRHKPPSTELPDLPASTFLLKLADPPGLKDWVYDNPKAVTVNELVRAIYVLDSGAAAGYARASDRNPHGGWDSFFSDLRAGKFEAVLRVPHHGSVDEVRDAELKELGGARAERIDIPPLARTENRAKKKKSSAPDARQK